MESVDEVVQYGTPLHTQAAELTAEDQTISECLLREFTFVQALPSVVTMQCCLLQAQSLHGLAFCATADLLPYRLGTPDCVQTLALHCSPRPWICPHTCDKCVCSARANFKSAFSSSAYRLYCLHRHVCLFLVLSFVAREGCCCCCCCCCCWSGGKVEPRTPGTSCVACMI
jgi:hypothetical protein